MNIEDLQFKDNSRISEYRICARKHFLHYEKDIITEKVQLALDFGTCWHAAMDTIFINFFSLGVRGSVLSRTGFEAFLEEWTKLGHPASIPLGDEKMYSPRTPGTALEMLMNYVKAREVWMNKLILISVEQPFAVPLDPDRPNRFYVGRLDKVVSENGRYWVIEHKTTSLYDKTKGMQIGFTDTFDPNSQIDGYSFAGKMLYGPRFMGVMIDASLVHKEHHNIFKFITINKGAGLANQWLQDVNVWWDRIEESRRNGKWPKSAPEACRTVYGPCSYKNLCLYTIDVHQMSDEIPGYKVEKWEPFSFDELKGAVAKTEEKET